MIDGFMNGGKPVSLLDHVERDPWSIRHRLANLCRIDFSYKLPKKIHVYQGVGCCFRPYKSLAIVQNQDNLTVYYKACESLGESIIDITAGLKRIRDSHPLEVKVVYVDNCCNVRQKLQAIFPNAQILLDPFHWFKRWDKLLLETQSEEASIFRGLMRRAVFVVTPEEFNRAKTVITEKLRCRNKLVEGAPSHKQIMAEARSVILPKDTLKSNVMSVLRFAFVSNLQ
jgi:hypothetical protein